ncbi:PAS domain S-box protein [Clostridium culturomicium]|uniref:PAS domain S-box protein n=1 Tax=Clostridium culturomicium TaxID=1499683 RepID=UPI003857E756
MERIFNYLDEGVIICDTYGEMLFVNDAIVSKLKFIKEEIIGKNIINIADSTDVVTQEILSNLSLYGEKRVKIKLYTKDKGKKMFNATLGKDVWNDQDVFCLILDEALCQGKHTKVDLERILDEIPYGVWVKDVYGKYVYVNQKHADIVGMNKCELLMTNDFDIWNYKDSEYFRHVDTEVLKCKKPILEQHKVTGINNEESWFETYKAPLIKNENTAKYVMGISRDITLSKKIEQELARAHEDMMTLNNMIPTNEYDAQIVLSSTKDDLISRFKADGGTIWLYDPKSTRLKPVVNFGISEGKTDKFKEVFIPGDIFKDPLNWRDEGILALEDCKNIILGKEELIELGVKYCGIYKITCNSEVIGLVHTLYKNKNDYSIKSDDFMKTMCNQLGMIIKYDMLSRDIKCEFSKRKEAEEELQLFLDTAVDLISIVDCNKKFKRVNSGWTNILGWTEEELFSMNSYDIIHPGDRVLTEKIVDELKSKLSIKGAVNRYVSKNGEVHWLEWSSRYIPEKGISICTGRDITKLKNAVEQKEIYEKALEMEKLKSEFFANISHEFKTPLNIILTIMQLIMKNLDNGMEELTHEKLVRYMESIKQNSYRLLRLVNNLIDITKIDTGYYEILLENANIINVIEDITMSVTEYTSEKGIELIFDTDIEELIIACDPDKIERIMLNLLSNAIKYSRPGGVIKVDIKSTRDKVIISVEDSGIGIEKNKLDKIFNRFSQVKNTLTRDCEGSGIGLSLVKSLIEMHGGNIYAESEFGKGTKFIFELPVKILDQRDVFIESRDVISSIVEKCNIEFSDIYN